jgi:phage FluMu protein gp41
VAGERAAPVRAYPEAKVAYRSNSVAGMACCRRQVMAIGRSPEWDS